MRIEGWQKELKEGIEEYKEIPFEWGRSDCIQFAGRVAARLLDYDLLTVANADDRYSTEEEAESIIINEYGGNIEAVLDELFTRRENEKYAQAGDLVSFEMGGKTAIGIIDNSGRYIAAKTIGGLVFLPFKSIKTAWEVK